MQRLEQFRIQPANLTAGRWPDPPNPRAYPIVIEKLNVFRLSHPNAQLIRFKPKPKPHKPKPFTPRWLPDTPYEVKSLSKLLLMSGMSTI
jgi:hypothetical protein